MRGKRVDLGARFEIWDAPAASGICLGVHGTMISSNPTRSGPHPAALDPAALGRQVEASQPRLPAALPHCRDRSASAAAGDGDQGRGGGPLSNLRTHTALVIAPLPKQLRA